MSPPRRRPGFHGDAGAEQGVSGHDAGRSGTDQRPAVCGGREVRRVLTPDVETDALQRRPALTALVPSAAERGEASDLFYCNYLDIFFKSSHLVFAANIYL